MAIHLRRRVQETGTMRHMRQPRPCGPILLVVVTVALLCRGTLAAPIERPHSSLVRRDACAGDWTCVAADGGPVWVRENPLTLDIQCYSLDALTCLTGTGSTCAPMPNLGLLGLLVHPVVCGPLYQLLHGITGYDTAGHWCAAGRALCPISAPAPAPAPSTSGSSVDVAPVVATTAAAVQVALPPTATQAIDVSAAGNAVTAVSAAQANTAPTSAPSPSAANLASPSSAAVVASAPADVAAQSASPGIVAPLTSQTTETAAPNNARGSVAPTAVLAAVTQTTGAAGPAATLGASGIGAGALTGPGTQPGGTAGSGDAGQGSKPAPVPSSPNSPDNPTENPPNAWNLPKTLATAAGVIAAVIALVVAVIFGLPAIQAAMESADGNAANPGKATASPNKLCAGASDTNNVAVDVLTSPQADGAMGGHQFLITPEVIAAREGKEKEEEPRPPRAPVYPAISSFTPTRDDELPVAPGARFRLLHSYKDNWCIAKDEATGDVGIIPEAVLDRTREEREGEGEGVSSVAPAGMYLDVELALGVPPAVLHRPVDLSERKDSMNDWRLDYWKGLVARKDDAVPGAEADSVLVCELVSSVGEGDTRDEERESIQRSVSEKSQMSQKSAKSGQTLRWEMGAFLRGPRLVPAGRSGVL